MPKLIDLNEKDGVHLKPPKPGTECICTICDEKTTDFYAVPWKSERGRRWLIYCPPCHEDNIRHISRDIHERRVDSHKQMAYWRDQIRKAN